MHIFRAINTHKQVNQQQTALVFEYKAFLRVSATVHSQWQGVSVFKRHVQHHYMACQ